MKRQLVEHIGSARDDTELKLLKVKAKQRLDELKPKTAFLSTRNLMNYKKLY